jgi:hypothetical protein
MLLSVGVKAAGSGLVPDFQISPPWGASSGECRCWREWNRSGINGLALRELKERFAVASSAVDRSRRPFSIVTRIIHDRSSA